MKSQQQDNSAIVRTSCKDCVLAIYEDKTQVGCLANRIEKFDNVIEAYDDDKEFYVVERLCNYYRDDRNNYINRDNKPIIEKIRFESQISFDLLFTCNDINQANQEKITKFYISIISKYDEKKIFPHICYNKITVDQKSIISKLSKLMKCKISYHKDSRFIHNLLMKTRNSYHIIFNDKKIEESIDPIYEMNNLVNEQMKKAVVIQFGDFKAISNLAYKIQSLKLMSNNYEEIVQKITEESKQMNLYHIL